MAVKLLGLICISISSMVFSQCLIPNNWTKEGYSLDLSVFQSMGINITGKDAQYTYSFSLANNLIQYRNSGNSISGYMLVQFNESKATHLKYATAVSNNIYPTISFNNATNIEWRFQYSPNLTIDYICDPTISTNYPYMEFTNIMEVLPNRWLFQISSSYFCPNNSATISLAKNKCIWQDESKLHTLNLTALYGTVINSKYSVCTDSMQYYGGYSYNMDICDMYLYIYKTQNGIVYYSALWNPFIQPSYNSTANSWTFRYSGLTVTWLCWPTTNAYNVVSWSSDKWVIDSKYACSDVCYFMTNDGEYGFDLHALSGHDIYGTSDDLSFSISYTPCSNYVKCNNENVMAMKWDVEKRECAEYLGIFKGNSFNGYNLTYDSSATQWKFVYDNGQLCKNGSGNDIFNIYYKCDRSVYDWKVTGITQINECEYSMYIVTIDACN